MLNPLCLSFLTMYPSYFITSSTIYIYLQGLPLPQICPPFWDHTPPLGWCTGSSPAIAADLPGTLQRGQWPGTGRGRRGAPWAFAAPARLGGWFNGYIILCMDTYHNWIHSMDMDIIYLWWRNLSIMDTWYEWMNGYEMYSIWGRIWQDGKVRHWYDRFKNPQLDHAQSKSSYLVLDAAEDPSSSMLGKV